MKMKKIVLLFSMIAVFFSITGCSNGQEEVNFSYTNTDIIYSTVSEAYQLDNISDAYRAYLGNSEEPMAKVLLTGVSNFDSAREECGEFVGYRSKEDGNSIEFDFSKLNAQDEEGYTEALTELNEFLGRVDATVEESGSNVIVTITAVYEKRDVIYSFVYEKNPAADYAYELSGQNVSAFQVKEITATPDYTFGEKMAKAGANTLMGMGTVFLVLIFISFIIAQFEKINRLSIKIGDWWTNRGKKEETTETSEVATVAAPAKAGTTVSTNPMDDSQLVAVITAAVVAANTSAGGTDKLIVRSIRKAKR